MDDSSFDKKIRQALLGYENSTPVSAGWSRMNLPSGQLTTIKKWLWTSLAVNAVLLALVPFMFFEMDGLYDRLTFLEKQGTALSKDLTGPVVNEYPIVLESLQDEQPEQPTHSVAYPMVFIDPPGSNGGQDHEMIFYHRPPSIASLGVIPSDYILDTQGLGEGQEEAQNTIKKEVKAFKKGKIDHKVLKDLVKAKYGRKIMMEYGVSGDLNYVRANSDYSGVAMGAGLNADIWFHPFWSVYTGLTYQKYRMASQDAGSLMSIRPDYTSSPLAGSLIRSDKLLHVASIPLILKYHLLLNRATTLNLGAGVTQTFLLKEKTGFDNRVLEKDGDGDKPADEEYHTFTETYVKPGINLFNTRMHYEVSISRQIRQSRVYWSAGMFYEKSLRGNGDIWNMSIIGIHTRLSIRK